MHQKKEFLLSIHIMLIVLNKHLLFNIFTGNGEL